MHRPLAVGAASGSFVSLALRFISDQLEQHQFDNSLVNSALDCVCPLEISSGFGELDIKSCLIGIFIGLLLGPLIDLIAFLRVWWGNWIRRRISSLARFGGPLYRVL